MFEVRKTDGVPFQPDRKGKLSKTEGKKAFDEVLRKEEGPEGDQEKKPTATVTNKGEVNEGMQSLYVEKEQKKKGSLFEIPEQPAGWDEDIVYVKEFPPKMKDESLSALFKGSSSKIQALREEAGLNKMAATLSVEEQPTKPFEVAQEQPDLSGVNLFAQNSAQIEATAKIEPSSPQTRVVELQQVVDKIVKELYTMEVNGKTTSVVTIKDHPILKEAQVVVTGFESAKKEFNISFENLTQVGQRLLDQNLDSLRLAMEQKGFTVHILTTTTQTENRIFSSESSFARQQDKGQGGGGQKNPQKEKES
jgi:hypothetical protein